MVSYESNQDIAEFRRDALTVLLVIVSGCWIGLLAGGLIYAQVMLRAWPLSPMLLLLGAIAGSDLLRRWQRTRLAAWMLIVGLMSGPALSLWLHGPSYALYCFLLVPVVATSVLIGGATEFGVAAMVVGLMIGLSAAWQARPGVPGVVDALGLTWAPSVVCFLAASIAHLNARNVFTMAKWAIDSQQKDARRAQLLYDQGEHLKHTLQQLEHANARLRLLNTELVEARQVAEAANQHKTQFLANVSHELRTPLNIILGHSRLGLETPNAYNAALPPALLCDLQHIHQSADHLSRLINDLLDLSRAEIDALELFPETIDPRSFLQDVFQSMAGGAEHNVAWRLRLPERLPPVAADPLRLRQILLNLLHNAAKFTQQGSIVLGAEVAPPHLHIWVEDTGQGIPFDLQERIFEPFVTGRVAQRRPEGIGLGLSIARRLVALHQGLLTLESQPHVGSAFHIYLPLPNLQPQPVRAPQQDQRALLLLSADEQIAAPIVAMSERQGLPLYRLHECDDLTSLLAEVHPAGLIWDTSFAAAGSCPVVQQLRGHPQFCQLPVTLYGQEHGATPELTLGMTDFVLKPVTGATLIESVQALRQPEVTGPILIVDDDPEAREFYRRLLADAFPGYTIHTAEHGRAALQLLAEEPPSLMILDLMMPEVDGFAVLEQMRARPATRRTPVLILSGQMLSFEDVTRLNHAHVTFHSKAILEPDELAKQMRQLLDGSERPSQQTSGFVKYAVAYMHQNYAHILSRQEIADRVGVSERYLSQIFREELGVPPWDYLNRYRIMRAKTLLETTNESVATVATQVGFDDPAYFSRVFRKETGHSPSAYRHQGER
jgi:signal transduction histidine kinase/AraC-like DNA-binding protein/FixJ family two-component response regulator